MDQCCFGQEFHQALIACDLDPHLYTTHSLRQGGATLLHKTGATTSSIRDCGGQRWLKITFRIKLSPNPQYWTPSLQLSMKELPPQPLSLLGRLPLLTAQENAETALGTTRRAPMRKTNIFASNRHMTDNGLVDHTIHPKRPHPTLD